MKTYIRIITRSFLFLLLVGVISCNNTPKPVQKTSTVNHEEIPVPSFNPDSAYLYVKQQVNYGPRVNNTPAHEKCAVMLAGKLRSLGAKVIVQDGHVKTFNGKDLKIENIIASYQPEKKSRILICSHWDSRPFADHDPDPKNRNKPIDGANDGASGVGVIIEIARQISISSPSIGVDLLLLDAEDYGPPQDQMRNEETSDWWGLGTQFWAKNPHVPGYTARFGVLLDMVGAPNATFLMEASSINYASSVVKNIWTTASEIGYSDYFIFEQGGSITDDHVFINKIINIPTIDIIHLDRNSQTGFYPYWHTLKDDMNSIDKNTLKAVGQTLLTVIYRAQN